MVKMKRRDFVKSTGATGLPATLDAGKIADMVILDANPLETMENVGKLAAVLQAGRLVYATGNVKET